MYTAEKLCLQWNNFKESLHKTIGNLRVTNKFNDVTLAAEGSEQIEAHKVILASSSPFFEYENETGNSDPKPPLFETSFSDQQEGVNYFELDKQIESMTRKTGKIFACKVCGKEGSRKDIVRHIESMHISGVSHNCDFCDKVTRSRDAMRQQKRTHSLATTKNQAKSL